MPRAELINRTKTNFSILEKIDSSTIKNIIPWVVITEFKTLSYQTEVRSQRRSLQKEPKTFLYHTEVTKKKKKKNNNPKNGMYFLRLPN